MHRRPVLGGHLVELVDDRDPAVGQDEHPRLEHPSSAREVVLHGGGRQPGGRRALAARVDRPGGDVGDVAQELALRGPRVAHDKAVDVAAHADPVRVLLRNPAEELEGDRLLLLLHPLDRRRQGEDDLVDNRGVVAELVEESDLLGRDLDVAVLHVLRLDRIPERHHVEGRVAHDPAARGARPLEALQHAVEDDPVAGEHLAREVLGQEDGHPLGMGAVAQRLGVLLDLDPLRVDVRRLLRDEPESRPPLGLPASPLGLRAFERFAEHEGSLVLGLVELRAAGDALEDGVPDLRADLGDAANDALDSDQVVEVRLADRPDVPVGRRREPDDPEAEPFGSRARNGQELPHRPSPGSEDLLRSFEQEVGEPGIGRVQRGERDLERALLGIQVIDLEYPGPETGLLEDRRPPALELRGRGEGPLGGDHAASAPSRVKAVAVSREQAGLPYIGEPCEHLHEAVDAQTPAPVRGHPEAERLEVAGELGRVESGALEVGREAVEPVLARSAAGDLQAPEVEVEVPRRPRVVVLALGVERLRLHRRGKVGDEVERGGQVLGDPLADRPLVLRPEVPFRSGTAEPLLAGPEREPRERQGELRDRSKRAGWTAPRASYASSPTASATTCSRISRISSALSM